MLINLRHPEERILYRHSCLMMPTLFFWDFSRTVSLLFKRHVLEIEFCTDLVIYQLTVFVHWEIWLITWQIVRYVYFCKFFAALALQNFEMVAQRCYVNPIHISSCWFMNKCSYSLSSANGRFVRAVEFLKSSLN